MGKVLAANVLRSPRHEQTTGSEAASKSQG
jgi:hypothetical protein